MVDANSLIEGHCKFRDGKKWKTRWAVVTKLSPVADCLQLQIYRDEKERARNGHTKASLSLQGFLALESGFTLDKESHTLAIICQDLCVVLAFDNRERLIQWTVRISNNLGEGQQFLVQLASVPTKSKLTPGPVKLHVTDRKFCLTGGIPPRLLGNWEVPHLRRYGIVDGRLVFEGGSRCGKGEGVHVLVPDPPQISLIIDALDMSSKGQLVRGPSRRFGSGVTDSPRKSLSRLSELRSAAQNEPSITPVAIPVANMAINSAISPTPRESRSAEALCNACNDNITGQTGSMWMSSEASSRCDLDSCDNISVISPEDAASNLHDQTHGHPKHPASPARTPAQGQPLQIAKPLPSSMERCLSCMSKLGQQGQDILSPSWTMDLNVSSAPNNTTAPPPLSSVNNGPQGSIGSGNSDRLSISSHGSSGGVTEYYYDTPRSVLVAEARRNAAARASTPPGVFQNGQMMHANGSCSSSSHYSSGTTQPSANGCSSPYRNPRNNQLTSHGCAANGFAPPVAGQQGAATATCPTGCHCQSHPRVMNSSAAGHGNSPIYYNGVAEQKAHGGKPPINLHSSSASHVGPYENYDFPRCTHPISFPPSVNHSCSCCPGEHSAATSTCGHSNGIDWSKKPPMDRSSIASTALGSDQTSEFYDTPPRHSCSCCAPPSCPCCVPGAATPGAVPSHHHHHAHAAQQSGAHSHYQNPACLMAHSDPMENYDVPPSHAHGIPASTKDLHGVPSVARSVNGEGKMPLVSAGGLPPRVGSNAHAIYAQVDKTKKTPRPLPMQHPHFVNCDNNHHQPIYENHGNTHCQPQHQQQPPTMQPTYANVEAPCKGHGQALKGKPPAPAPEPQVITNSHPCTKAAHGNPTNNYVNLEYTANNVLLYENTQEVRQEPVATQVQKVTTTTTTEPVAPSVEKSTTDLVAQTSGDSPNLPSDNDDTKTSSDELHSIPEEKEVEPVMAAETKENEYENTRVSTNESGDQEPKQNDASDPPSVQDEPSASEITEASASTSSKENTEEPNLPLRRSSSVPCKGGHANRGSASSSDSGVSGDGGLFFDDSSPLNDIGSLCLHESLPRKSQRNSPGASGKNTSATSTPKPQEPSEEIEGEFNGDGGDTTEDGSTVDPLLNRHYETIDESKAGVNQTATVVAQENTSTVAITAVHTQPINPTVAAVKSGEICTVQRPKNPLTLVSDANSTSSGASDMSDYIETLSSCSRGSIETVTSIPVNNMGTNNISVSPRKSSNMKPRSGKEYFKIDRSMFKNE
ncbi:unnamed protein product [Orchesella dallaii]|uniref:Protein chico n=1 Tax=Orchesella dallaii TaxID=48710 RepID=A0ABP1QKV2_9HEXA